MTLPVWRSTDRNLSLGVEKEAVHPVRLPRPGNAHWGDSDYQIKNLAKRLGIVQEQNGRAVTCLHLEGQWFG